VAIGRQMAPSGSITPIMPLNIPIALTWLRIAMIPLIVGLFYLPDAWTASGWRDCVAAIAFIVAAVTD